MKEWTDEIVRALAAPFPEKDVSWVIVATKHKNTADHSDLWAPYLDADAIRDRLDQVCGPGGWAMDVEAASPTSIICRLTVLGVTRADVGDGKDADQPLKAAATDSLKRAAVNFGIGRYLHNVGKQWRKPEAGQPRGNSQGGQGSRPPKAAPPRPAQPNGGAGNGKPLTPAQKGFQDLMKANGLSFSGACDHLGAHIGATPQEAFSAYLNEVVARKGCDMDTAYKAATEALSSALAEETLA